MGGEGGGLRGETVVAAAVDCGCVVRAKALVDDWLRHTALRYKYFFGDWTCGYDKA